MYHDIPWVPYEELFLTEIGFVADLKELPELLARLTNMTDEDFARREKNVRGFRDTHYTYPVIMDQIKRFMSGTGNPSDLRCRPLPPSVKGFKDGQDLAIEEKMKKRRKGRWKNDSSCV